MTTTGSKYFYNGKESEKYEGVRTADNFSNFVLSKCTLLSLIFPRNLSLALNYITVQCFRCHIGDFLQIFVREKQQSSHCCCGQ